MRYETGRTGRRGHPDSQTDTLARALGLVSLALGAAELLAPRAFTKPLGLRGRESLVQACGAREIATGIGLLASRDPAPWMWGRVAGDAIDLVALAPGLDRSPRRRENTMMVMAAVAGIAALDLYCATTLARESPTRLRPLRDYSGRSGFRRPPAAMRGIARETFEMPRDMREPPALRPSGWDRDIRGEAGARRSSLPAR